MQPDQTPRTTEVIQPNAKRLETEQQIKGNIDVTTTLFDKNGQVTEKFRALLKTLPLIDKETGAHIADSASLDHHSVEKMLQMTFFKPLEAKFSFELKDGELPSEAQLASFDSLQLLKALTVSPGSQFDCGVVFGGTLAATVSRTANLLNQGAQLSSVALLGGQRPLKDFELGDNLKAAIGTDFYDQLEAGSQLPQTEYEMMQCVWQACTQREPSLANLPVVEVDSQMRIGRVKEAPGTPDTVVDLANTLTSGNQIVGLSSAPTSFLLSSSQPHAVRQREDFLSAMLCLNYPNLTDVSVVGYETANIPTLKLCGLEVAKLVHAQHLLRYS